MAFTSPDFSSISIIVALSVCVIASFIDVRDRRIPNLITLPTIAGGVVGNLVWNGTEGLILSVAGSLVGALLFSLPVGLLGRGAGDLKLLAAIGALCGPGFVLWTALWAGAAGGLIAFLVLFSRRRFGVVLAGMVTDAGSGTFPVAQSGISLPYAVPIAIGAMLTTLLQ